MAGRSAISPPGTGIIRSGEMRHALQNANPIFPHSLLFHVLLSFFVFLLCVSSFSPSRSVSLCPVFHSSSLSPFLPISLYSLAVPFSLFSLFLFTLPLSLILSISVLYVLSECNLFSHHPQTHVQSQTTERFCGHKKITHTAACHADASFIALTDIKCPVYF